MKRYRVALIGTGNIAETHAAVLRGIDGVELAAVADLNRERAEAFAARWGVTRVYAEPRAIIDDGSIGVVHVLVPPPSHRSVAEPLLRAGLHVLIEKPMATTVQDCDALIAAARVGGAALGVNHNLIHHPAHREIRKLLSAGAIGPIRHSIFRFNVPLLQLTTRQFGHWMFGESRNLLLELGVHPLSQIDDILGPASELSALAGPSLFAGPSEELRSTWLVSLICARGTAQFLFSLGESYPSWGATIIGDDGAIHADYVANRVWHERPHKWLEALSSYRAGMDASAEIRRQSRRNLANFVASTVNLKPRSDGFFVSMRESIATFYSSLDRGRAALDGMEGRRIVALCEAIASSTPTPKMEDMRSVVAAFANEPAAIAAGVDIAMPGKANVGATPDRTASSRNPATASVLETGTTLGVRMRGQLPPDVAVVGGTGFIGKAVVSALVGRGMRVAVMARNPGNLPEEFEIQQVSVHRGDVASRGDVARAISGASTVVNLAHAGAATTSIEIERAIVGGALNLAEICIENKVRRLVHVSSIAALYLGDPNVVVDGRTICDPLADRREPYSRAKAIAEREVIRLHRERGLPVCILRPGIVVGKGGMAFHSGVGHYNSERHCLGWNRGENPLPFVLVDDVADAIVLALEAPRAVGSTYSVVGGVRLTAREYVAELARALDRPLEYHPQSLIKLCAVDLCKWALKRAIGRRDGWFSYRDLRSRGLVSRFDCAGTERDLDWHPVSDRRTFLHRGIEVHARTR
jgi:predicted dehydrogenase/nucleoside-diphosphate-sugar epimerase